MEGEQSARVRRIVLFGVPFLYICIALMHPTANPEVGDAPAVFIWLHLAQLFLIGGLAYVLWLLVDELNSRARMGPIGMALFLAGIVWLELRPGVGEAEPDALRQGI